MDLDPQGQRERIEELEQAGEEAEKLRTFRTEIETYLLNGKITSQDVYRIAEKLANHHTQGKMLEFLSLTTLPGQIITTILKKTLSEDLARVAMQFFRQFVNDHLADMESALEDEAIN